MRFEKTIVRFSCRKEKKAFKNHPCNKTKQGRYIIEVMNSWSDFGYEHPKADFFHDMLKGTTPWRYNENKYPQDDISVEKLTNLFD